MKNSRKFRNFQIRFNEALGDPKCPYVYRTVIVLFGFSLRLHIWKSGDGFHFHDHPWWFITFVLKGSYTDVYNDNGIIKQDVLKHFSVRYRSSNHKHYVDVPKNGCWTILLTGKPIRKWGFYIENKFKRPLKYFDKFGHPPCYEQ